MFSRRHLPFQIFTLAFVAAMFFPRVLPEGMFPDGLTYASIARNMAEGRGGFWSPYFSSSFWIPFNGNQYEFYGHPTLAMGLQSFLFRLVGDHWFVEKFYNSLIWLTTVCIVIQLWQQNGRDRQLWWLPVLVWYLMPAVIWSYPNFVLDGTMAVFSIAAAMLILRGLGMSDLPIIHRSSSTIHYSFILAGLLLHLAFLTKGPVGLFPLAIPLIYWFVYRPQLAASLYQTTILSIITFGSLALWYFYAPARFFWTKYLDIQVLSSIGQTDQTEEYTWLAYLFIPQQILIQGAALVGIAFFLFLFSKSKNTAFIFEKETNRKALFFSLIFLSGSLPMVISHKTRDFFLLPALPFLALSFSLWLQPTVSNWFEKFKLNSHKSLIANRLMAFLAVGVLVYSAMQMGRVGREREILNDMTVLRGAIEIPIAAKICVCDSMRGHFNYHAYFQRYHRWELAKPSDTTAQYFINQKGFCRSSELDSAIQVWGFRRVEVVDLQTFQLYQR